MLGEWLGVSQVSVSKMLNPDNPRRPHLHRVIDWIDLTGVNCKFWIGDKKVLEKKLKNAYVRLVGNAKPKVQ